MLALVYTYIFVSLILHSITCAPQKDYFDEELLLKPLSSGHVYAYFQFTTIWEVEFEATSCKLK
jgi:hypothetical protein